MEQQFPVLDTRLDDNPIIDSDLVLPSQFWGERRNLSPEIRLVAAILVDAVNCLLGRNAHKKAQAHDWFASPLTGPFTYWDCCQWLNINHELFWSKLQKFASEGRRVKRIKGHLVECNTFRPFAWR